MMAQSLGSGVKDLVTQIPALPLRGSLSPPVTVFMGIIISNISGLLKRLHEIPYEENSVQCLASYKPSVSLVSLSSPFSSPQLDMPTFFF